MYLKELQGLRAIAALLVAGNHIWFQRVSGGVDAFFVITGFFLFQNFLKADRQNWSAALCYYQKTFARIIPSTSIVILATCLIFQFSGLEMLWYERIKSAIAAIFFIENYWLAANGVDYLSRGQAPSPFQQMWALSVQAQTYLLLPVLILIILSCCRRMERPDRPAVVVLALLVLTFGYALLATHWDQPYAYFDTAARLWEFLAGGCLAIGIARVQLSKPTAKLVGYGGLLVLISFAAVLPVQQTFPGAAALVPVTATAAIIIAAANGAQMQILTAAPMQWLGNLSFTFYLWHWPLYILAWDLTGSSEIGLRMGSIVLAASFLLALATTELAERPFRRLPQVKGHPLPALVLCAVAMGPALAGTAIWASSYVALRDLGRDDMAAVRRGEKVARVVPNDIVVKSDTAVSYRDGCHQKSFTSDHVIECTYGNPEGSWTVVLVGGSHALQWLPALQIISELRPELRIISMSKSGCTLTMSMTKITVISDADACLRWSEKAVARILELGPEAVITIGTRIGHQGGEIVPPGYLEAWSLIDQVPVIAVRDNPGASFDIAACVDRLGPRHESCSLLRATVLREQHFAQGDLPPNVIMFDFSDLLCDDQFCPPVRNGLLVYRDSEHLTATFVASLAHELDARMVAAGFLRE